MNDHDNNDSNDFNYNQVIIIHDGQALSTTKKRCGGEEEEEDEGIQNVVKHSFLANCKYVRALRAMRQC
jgi:hypothetical protein